MNDFNETDIPEEEEISILTLTDEDGTETDFELIDIIEYDGTEYAFLLPLDEPEDEEDTSVIILKVTPIDEETEEYTTVEDEALLAAVYDRFKELYADEFNFVD